MQLTLWTYEGPPHVGAMRIATAMKGLHYVLHAPQGDTYADLLFTMIERRASRPPVTYTTFQARDLGGDTAELFKTAAGMDVTMVSYKGAGPAMADLMAGQVDAMALSFEQQVKARVDQAFFVQSIIHSGLRQHIQRNFLCTANDGCAQ